MAHIEERNQDATVWVGELDLKVSEAILWELMLQAGPVGNYRYLYNSMLIMLQCSVLTQLRKRIIFFILIIIIFFFRLEFLGQA